MAHNAPTKGRCSGVKCKTRLFNTRYEPSHGDVASLVFKFRIKTVARSEQSKRMCRPDELEETLTVKADFSRHHLFISCSWVTHTAGRSNLASLSTLSKADLQFWNNSGWNKRSNSSPRQCVWCKILVQACVMPSSPSLSPSYSCRSSGRETGISSRPPEMLGVDTATSDDAAR